MVTEDESSKYTVIVIGDLPSGQSLKSKVIHLPLRSEEELDSAQFEVVAGSISEAVRDSGHLARGSGHVTRDSGHVTRESGQVARDSGHVIVTSAGDPGLAISLVIPHLVIQHNMGVGEAARHIERLRPGLALPAPVLVKMEDWWSSRGQQSRMEAINTVSQSWLPLVFLSIFLFLLLRAIFCFAGIDTHCILSFMRKLFRI